MSHVTHKKRRHARDLNLGPKALQITRTLLQTSRNVCCSVLQCAAVCCSVLQCVAVCCSVLQCAAVCCSVLQCVAPCSSSSSDTRRSNLQSRIPHRTKPETPHVQLAIARLATICTCVFLVNTVQHTAPFDSYRELLSLLARFI